MAKSRSAHMKKFAKIAKSCQAKIKVGGKARAKAVGKCMKAAFKKK